MKRNACIVHVWPHIITNFVTAILTLNDESTSKGILKDPVTRFHPALWFYLRQLAPFAKFEVFPSLLIVKFDTSTSSFGK